MRTNTCSIFAIGSPIATGKACGSIKIAGSANYEFVKKLRIVRMSADVARVASEVALIKQAYQRSCNRRCGFESDERRIVGKSAGALGNDQ
jgi:hypothetical protein